MDTEHSTRLGSALLYVWERLEFPTLTDRCFHLADSDTRRPKGRCCNPSFLYFPLTFPIFPFTKLLVILWLFLFLEYFHVFFYSSYLSSFVYKFFLCCTIKFLSLESLFPCSSHFLLLFSVSFDFSFLFLGSLPSLFYRLLYLFLYSFPSTLNNFHFMLHSTVFCSGLFYGYW